MNKKYLLVLAGPTASGKTDLAIQLAQAFQTEIISADSRQFYPEIAIGTAAPTKKQLSLVKHHMVHQLKIDQPYDVATYENDVLQLLDKLFQQHDLLIISGGSGLYIDAVCRGLDNIPETSPEVRNRVEELYSKQGIKALQQALEKEDPVYYKTVDKMNPRRLQRALEVCWQTGQPFSFYRRRQPSPRAFEVVWTAITTDRTSLINRINKRVEGMMADGLLAEARAMYPFRYLNALKTVGFAELFDYFEGRLSLEEAIEQIKVNTRRYAKRQMTWLRKNKEYKWYESNELPKLIDHVKAVTGLKPGA
jgi:tRNA dimethylallyltransferase